MKIPAFLLRRLYVRGSLTSTDSGFAFELSNKLGSGYAHRLFPLTLDGTEISMTQTSFKASSQSVTFDSVSEHNPFTLPMNKSTIITVQGQELTKGVHTIGMRFVVPGLGELRFDFSDTAVG